VSDTVNDFFTGLPSRVDPGKTADLVLVAANPLEDIRNLHLVRAVVLNGRFLDRGQLDGAVPRFQ